MIDLINVKTFSGKYIYIGRGSALGNPYYIGKDGTRSEVIEKYRKWLWKLVKIKGEVRGAIERLACDEMQNIVLGCHCVPLPCHGEVIINCIKWYRRANHIKQFNRITYDSIPDPSKKIRTGQNSIMGHTQRSLL